MMIKKKNFWRKIAKNKNKCRRITLITFFRKLKNQSQTLTFSTNKNNLKISLQYLFLIHIISEVNTYIFLNSCLSQCWVKEKEVNLYLFNENLKLKVKNGFYVLLP